VPNLVAIANSDNGFGKYYFVDMASGFDAALDGVVQVMGYYDVGSSHLYVPSQTTGALGYETGRFDGYVDSFSFGPTSSVALVNRYSFDYLYNSGGDYYYGQAYMTAAQAQAVYYTPPSGGHYEFVDMAYGFAPVANPVQVTAYYDAGTQYTYAASVTTGTLGSETGRFYGYVDSFNFTPTSAANPVNRYSFVYWYGGAGDDYYYGQAYISAAQAQGVNSHYQFVDMAYGFAAPVDPANPVRVAGYYDANSQHVYTTYNTMGLMGYETAWLYGNVASFSFGPTIAADLVNRYSFVYWYNSGGDYYYGRSYSTVAQAEAAAAYNGAGHYQFVDMAYGFAPAATPVQVAAYYDASAGHSYSAYGATGTLDSENAWFIGDTGTSINFDPDQPAS
jgi:hypothetical protein